MVKNYKNGLLFIVLSISQIGCSSFSSKNNDHVCMKDREYSKERIQAIVDTAGGYKPETYVCQNNQNLAKVGDGYICSSADWEGCSRDEKDTTWTESEIGTLIEASILYGFIILGVLLSL